MISLAIHERRDSFSTRWIERAAALGLSYQIVDCHAPDILLQLKRHRALLWHWTHTSWADLLVARHVVRAAEAMGLRVFPSTETCWSFDDKLAQKYQLEAAGAPFAHVDCFFSEAAALHWVETASFPRVMKLRRGAGSRNVRLVRSRDAARALVRRAFRDGFPCAASPLSDAPLKLARARARRDLVGPLLRLPRTLLAGWRDSRELPRERGYVYFQEFLPGNRYDVRVTVIGPRAFAFSRNVRKDDFRASGSGSIDYSPDRVTPECLRIAFDVSRKLKSQSTAFDFAFDADGRPKILEVSYGYVPEFVHACPGHWTPALDFVTGQVWPQDAILDDLLDELEEPESRPRTMESVARPARTGARQ